MIVIQPSQFRIQKAEIEGRVVDDQLRPAHELEEICGYLCKYRFVGQGFTGNAVHFYRALVNVALRIDVTVEMVSRQTPVDQFHATNFDYAVPLADFQASGLRVQYNQSHSVLPLFRF